VSRIKIMAELDIAEKRMPQDGRMSVTAQGKKIDLRVATLPTVHGEKVVIRVLDKSSAPKVPARKVWLPLMIAVYHLQKRHPDAGKFRIWSLLGHPEISVRTVARMMALNKEVYDDIPHVRKRGPKLPPQPHPYKASRPHQYWFIDGRMMDFALDGVKWWSLIILGVRVSLERKTGNGHNPFINSLLMK
jgi:hypothetical protein